MARSCSTTRSSCRPATTSTGPASSARTSRPLLQRWRESGVLQRERGVLEDQVGAQHRRIEHCQPDAGDLQGDPLRRSHRSAGPADLDGHLDGSAVQPASRRRAAAERAHRSVVRRQRRHDRHHRAGSVQQAAVLAQYPGGQPAAGQSTTLGCRDRHPRLRMGRGRRQRVPAARADGHVVHDRHRGADLHRLRQRDYDWNRDPSPDAVPRPERRPRVRRRDSAMVVGPGQR